MVYGEKKRPSDDGGFPYLQRFEEGEELRVLGPAVSRRRRR